jgi:hypothetical protein
MDMAEAVRVDVSETVWMDVTEVRVREVVEVVMMPEPVGGERLDVVMMRKAVVPEPPEVRMPVDVAEAAGASVESAGRTPKVDAARLGRTGAYEEGDQEGHDDGAENPTDHH